MDSWGWRASWTDRLLGAIVWLLVGVVLVAFLLIIGDVFRHGVSALDLEFLLESPRNAGREGGVLPMIVSTLLIVGVCLVVSVPVGLGSAVYLATVAPSGSRMAVWIGRSLDVLAGVPSIVFGLFGNALFCDVLGMGFSILAGGLTLSCMVLPLFIRTTEAGLRAVPRHVELNAVALGLSRTTTLTKLALPAAAPAIVAGFVLALGRAMAETAALIFTSGYVDRMPESLLDSGRSLSVHIYDLAMNVPGGTAKAWGAALVLLSLLVLINAAAGTLTRRVLARGYETL